MKKDLEERIFEFAVDVFDLLLEVPDKNYFVYKNQLLKCSSSVGANYEESQGGISYADFSTKVFISLKEIRESNFFLRILLRTNKNIALVTELERLVQESSELKLILGSIAKKTKENIDKKRRNNSRPKN